MKNFYLQIIVFLLIIISMIFAIQSYYTYTQNRNFSIINERQSVIIQLPNTEYIEITSINDNVSVNSIFEKPFSTSTKIIKNSNLENSIAKTNTHTEYVENRDMNRFLSLTPISDQSIKVQIDVNTAYTYQENLTYNIQIDYTNKTKFKIENNTINFVDKGCNINIVGEDIKYSFSDNGQSVILSKKYEPKMSFNFNFNIECN